MSNSQTSKRPLSNRGDRFGKSSVVNDDESTSGVPSKEPGNLNPEIQAFFKCCSEELDKHHDRYERILKMGRDITIESKRVIFLLHRVHEKPTKQLLEEAEKRLCAITNNSWKHVSKELKGNDPYHYLKAFSPAMQEFIEAASFLHYIKHGTLITLNDLREMLKFEDELQISVPVQEYLLGIADLAGELMRLCINSVGQGRLDTCFETCKFLRELHEMLSSLNMGFHKELKRKLVVSRQSLQKVEAACYAIQVRGSEIPNDLLAAQAVLAGNNVEWNEDCE